MVETHSRLEIEEQIDEYYRAIASMTGYALASHGWTPTSPVFIDFGTDFLVKLEAYDDSGLPCVHYVAKELFVRDAMNLESARDIGNTCSIGRPVSTRAAGNYSGS